MSPVTNRLIQSQYCASSGRSRPNWWLKAATARGSARGPSMARATSPGSSWPPTKTMTLSSERRSRFARIRPNSTALIVAVRRGRDRLGLLHAVDDHLVHELVVEGDQPLDAGRFVHRVGIVPDHVLASLAVDGEVVVAR